MSLRCALLALLEARPMTGYELAKQFDHSAGYVWHASHSQIYPELRRMEEAGLIRAAATARGRQATKRTYSITDEGCSELRRWVDEIELMTRERSAAHLKATYLEYASYDAARRQFETHLADHLRQVAQWEAHVEQLVRRDTRLLRQRLAQTPEAAHDAIVDYKVHVYRGLISRAQAEVDWAREGLELVDRLQEGAAAQGADRPSVPLARPTSATSG